MMTAVLKVLLLVLLWGEVSSAKASLKDFDDLLHILKYNRFDRGNQEDSFFSQTKYHGDTRRSFINDNDNEKMAENYDFARFRNIAPFSADVISSRKLVDDDEDDDENETENTQNGGSPKTFILPLKMPQISPNQVK